MRSSIVLRWAAVCAALVIVFVPVGAGAQDEEHPQGEAMAEEHPHGEMSAEEMAMMKAYEAAGTAGAEHALLADTAGSYKLTITMWHAPGAPPETTEGTAERTMTLGGRVLEEKVASSMMGAPFEGLGRTGYDNVRKTYWSTWTDSMSTALSVMHGTIAEDGSSTFEGEFVDPPTGGTKAVRIEGRMDGDKEVLEFYEPGPDGTEVKVMEIVYERAG
jgi:hypothetical protein